MTEPVPIGQGGALKARIVVNGRTYDWVGALSWGHEPYGYDPICWACALCGALTVDIPRHSGYHDREGR